MPTRDAISWFKQHFQNDINTATAGTPYTLDMLTAIACQETGYIWDILRRRLSVEKVLELCVGDSLDYNPQNPSKSRSATAFPKNKADLLTRADGAAMFAIARQALEEMSQYVPGYSGAVSNPNKFCHGFGIFQYDIQFFKDDPQYFLQKRWASFGACLQVLLEELRSAQKSARLAGRATLSDLEMCHVAIAYNTGRFNSAKGLAQGHKSDGKFYGERIYAFLQLAKQVPAAAGAVVPRPPAAPTRR